MLAKSRGVLTEFEARRVSRYGIGDTASRAKTAEQAARRSPR